LPHERIDVGVAMDCNRLTDCGHDHGQEVTMRTIKASEFRARCLKLMDEVAASGEPVVITKNGKPVAAPPGRSRAQEYLGSSQRSDRDSRRHHRAARCRMGGESLILLDTHCLIWMDQADRRMGRSARALAGAAIGATLVTADQRILSWTGRSTGMTLASDQAWVRRPPRH
jgi:antitoxin (DNA-binding transcriptional repressor) of toxin-antitoxin stability system